MSIPELIIPPHCEYCPTVEGIMHGHDPEAYQILTSGDYFRYIDGDEDEGLCELWCPWRSANCTVYPVELAWARECYKQGIIPPVKLHPRFIEASD